MRDEDGFDLAGRDVLAAPHDDVIEPAGHVEESVAIELAGVVRREPAVDALARRREVFARDLVAAHVDLTAFTRRECPAVGIAYLDFDGRQHAPDRTQTSS